MVNSIKRRCMSILLTIAMLVPVVLGMKFISVNANAVETFTTSQIDATIAWAMEQNGNSSWETIGRTGRNNTWKCNSYRNCPQFVRSAFVVGGNDDPDIAVYNPNVWWAMWTMHRHVTTEEAPPRGALAFYDFGSTGHVALSLGNGKVIQGGFNTVRITSFNEVGGCTYKGWTTWRDMGLVPLTKPTQHFTQSAYCVGDSISVTWDASSATSNLDYYLVMLINENGNTVFKRSTQKTSSYVFKVSSPGVYDFYVKSYDLNGIPISTRKRILVFQNTSEGRAARTGYNILNSMHK